MKNETRISNWRLFLIILFVLSLAHTTHAADKITEVRHSVKPLDLSRPPTNEELMAAGQLGGQLYPTGEVEDANRQAEINLSFGNAIQEWNKHQYKKAVGMFQDHIGQYPDSPWAAEAVLHMGCDAQYNGRYSEAEKDFRWIIEQYGQVDDEGAQKLVEKATLRLGNQLVLQNNFSEASDNFSRLTQYGSDWRERTYASHWIRRLSGYRANHAAMLNCGVKALAKLLRKKGKGEDADQVAEIVSSSPKGFSMEDLKRMAAVYDYKLNGLKLSAAQLKEIPLPAIMQISGRTKNSSGHYWVLEKIKDDKLSLFDPQSGRIFNQTMGEFSKEWEGNALVFTGKEELPGVALSDGAMENFYGGCCGVPRAEHDLGGGSCGAGGGGGGGGNGSGGGGGNGSGGGGGNDIAAANNGGASQSPSCTSSSKGAPVWWVNMVNLNFFMEDTPLWYKSAVGPSVEIRLSYNSQSAIAQNEPFGNKWQFYYGTYPVVDTGGQVTIFMPDGRRDVYTPDGLGGYTRPYGVYNTLTRLAENHFELAFPRGMVYVYDIPAGTSSLQPFLTEIRDAYGQRLTLGYDSNVHLTTITDALGNVTTLTYTNDRVTSVTDPFGRSASFEYDGNSNLTKITDMGGYATDLTYDADVYLSGINRGEGWWTFYTEPADGIFNEFNAYPAPGDPMWEDYRITATNPMGGKEEYHYDGYSHAGWIVGPNNYAAYESPEVNNFSLDVPKTRIEYQSTSGERGEIASITGPENFGIWFLYDTEGNVIQVNRAGWSHTYTYNSMGRITSYTDPNDIVTTFGYAPNDVDLTEITNGLGTITLDYNGSHDITSVTDRMNKTTGLTYNGYGQLTSRTNPLGITTTYVYNPAHQLSEMTKDSQTIRTFTYDSLGRIHTYTDSSGMTRTYTNNNLDDVTKITYPDAKFVNISYSQTIPHLITGITERSGRTVQYSYNALNKVTNITNPEGGTTTYGYDAAGNVVHQIDPMGNKTIFTYDKANRLVGRTFSDGTVREYWYDSANRLIYVWNARGELVSIEYDGNDNITYSEGETYEYDAYNRLWHEIDGIGEYWFDYDDNSRLISVDGPLPNDTFTFDYDDAGRLTNRSLQGGQSFTYVYDNLDRLKSVESGAGVFSYTYSGSDPRVQRLTRPGGSYTDYQYDILKRLSGVTNKNSSEAVINQYLYGYNSEDLRSTETITNGTSMTFQNELTTYSYNNVNQLLNSVPAKTFAYDDDGNMTRGYTPEGYVYEAAYDVENRLTSVQFTDGLGDLNRTEYQYRGNGMMARKREYKNDVLTKEINYVGLGALPWQERDADNNIIREYTWGLSYGGGIGGLLSLRQGGQDFSYLYDGKGNVSALINGAQSAAAAYLYDPFGQRMAKTGALDQPYQFSTKQYDEMTGLSYYGYRFYSLSLGRWMTRDPIGERGGINLYGFVENNPVNRIDPTGLNPPSKSKYDPHNQLEVTDNGSLGWEMRDTGAEYDEADRFLRDMTRLNDRMNGNCVTNFLRDIGDFLEDHYGEAPHWDRWHDFEPDHTMHIPGPGPGKPD